jgi:hypothetical protein
MEACIRPTEPDPTARNQLMIGPDGTVHVVPTGAGKNSSEPVEKEGRYGAEQRASASRHTDLQSERDAGLLGIRRAPGGGVCFSY